MLVKREMAENADAAVLQDPRDMARAILPKPKFPAMQAYIRRLQRLKRRHQDMVTQSSLPEPSAW